MRRDRQAAVQRRFCACRQLGGRARGIHGRLAVPSDAYVIFTQSAILGNGSSSDNTTSNGIRGTVGNL
jgi:hypothetical protein